MNILEILVKQNVIKPNERSVIEKQARAEHTSISEVLKKQGIDEKKVLSVVGEYFHLPYRLLENSQVPTDILKYIPEESAQHYRFVPLGIVNNSLEVVVASVNGNQYKRIVMS